MSTGYGPVRITRSIVVPTKMSRSSCLRCAPMTMRSASIELCRSQNAVEGIAGNDHGAAFCVAQFGHGADLLSEDSFRLARLDLDQVLRMIVVHDMDESEFGVPGLRHQACSPQRAM